jgi:hypothetical protein
MEKKCYYVFKDTTMSKIDEKFNNGSYLYHYTSISSACNILKNNSLKFNKLKRINNINESYRSICYDSKLCYYEEI